MRRNRQQGDCRRHQSAPEPELEPAALATIPRPRPDAPKDVDVVLDSAAQQLGFSVLDTGHQLILRQLRKKILKKVAVIRDHVNPNFRPETMLLKVISEG
jgi:hypothetical protein